MASGCWRLRQAGIRRAPGLGATALALLLTALLPRRRRLAEQLLLKQARQLSGSDAPAPSSPQEAFCSIFMVGDNPAADIRGANRAGAPWVPVLVRTGVWQGQQLQPGDAPQVVVDDVLGAVQAGLHRYRQAKWHVHR